MTIKTDVLYSQWWHNTVISKLKTGESNRSIASSVFGNSSFESRIRTFLEREDVKSILSRMSSEDEFKRKQHKPRILYFDLESSLMEGYFFRIWDENIPMRRVKKQSHLLSASWAFNDEEVQGVRVSPEQVKVSDDLDVVVKMVEAVNSADLIVTFNGKKFDVKLLNTRALFWGLPPIRQPKHIDLFEQAKRVFKFPSNSMQNISMYLGEEGKLQTSGNNLWERCAEWENYEECDKALEEMLLYNKKDIDATRDLYYRFQGWMKNVPNLGTITNENTENKTLRCVHCGSDDIFAMNDKTYTSASSFDLYRCGNETCRGISRVTKNGKQLVGVI